VSEIPTKWVPIIEELSRLVADADPRTHRTFEALGAPLYRDLVHAELEALRADPSHGNKNRRVAGNLWALFADAEITLSLSVVREPDGALVSSLPYDLFVSVVGPGRVTVEHLRTTVNADERDILGRRHELELQATHTLSEGTALHLHGGVDVLRFAECRRPTAILSLNAHRSRARLAWDYDVRTRQPIACSLVEGTASQVVFLLGVIEAQGRTDHLAFVRRALAHNAHAVRWAAVRALWKLDIAAALAATRASLDDEHPHVRRAAQRTLELFDSQQMKEEPHAARSHV
jgi:hypothetical protein